MLWPHTAEVALEGIANPLTCGDRVNLVQQSKYHGCSCPGSLRHQDIRTHDIDYVE